MTQQSETDSQLMARLCQGDDSALDLLIHRHRAAAEQYARVLLQDAGAAEEAVMDAFARVYLLRERYHPPFAFQTWAAGTGAQPLPVSCAAVPGSPFPWMTLCPRASRLPRKHWPCKRKNACVYGKCWRS